MPEVLSLVFAGGTLCILLDMGRLVFVFLGGSRLGFLIPISGDAETFSLEFGEVLLFEQ